jgi:mRNA interferase RelE/StbE
VRWRLRIDPRAELELASLPDDVRRRIARRIDALQIEPRPRGSQKLAGHDGVYRIRVGDYRVLYRIEDEVLIVLVIRIGHRRDIYR